MPGSHTSSSRNERLLRSHVGVQQKQSAQGDEGEEFFQESKRLDEPEDGVKKSHGAGRFGCDGNNNLAGFGDGNDRLESLHDGRFIGLLRRLLRLAIGPHGQDVSRHLDRIFHPHQAAN